ncbi:MAG: hypothetical protein PF442_10770 [Desulfobulbaceae bacterium]|jgi:hypothetical protein|nr:hypothetical protein [Desulfobulbaceae bacterium]
MPLYKNAIASIQIGVEDYLSADERRKLSAVRNIFSGILLLYKEKLCDLSPAYDKELFIKIDIRPHRDKDGNITYRAAGKSKKTVHVQQIKDRFSSLGVKIDWTVFDQINKIRNDIEHYYTTTPEAAIKEILAKSFVIIKDFIYHEFLEEPIDALGEACWNELLKISDVYESEKKLCVTSLSKIDWKYKTLEKAKDLIRCPACSSDLIKTDDTGEYSIATSLICSTCGNPFSFEEVISECVTEVMYADSYIAMTDGGDPPHEICPECDEDTFVFEEECCLACGYEIAHHECMRCGCGLSLGEQHFEGFCDYCQHMYDKMMDE